eukprot:TRINITY_DN54299_c0_g1_i1.p1 TRINITY_DN54299_c0_g1~~TRINITY_DN54299_c0_g1_i1.p1  ORF type:complete len:348 (-),score=73.89 TRINITY_DN54299_c0_g1_i1:101-1099(-)
MLPSKMHENALHGLCWNPTEQAHEPSTLSSLGDHARLHTLHSRTQWRPRWSSFFEGLEGFSAENKGIDGEDQEQWGSPFLEGKKKKSIFSKGFSAAKALIAKFLSDDDDKPGNLESYTNDSLHSALKAKQAAWAATRAAHAALKREAKVADAVARADHAWDATVQAEHVGKAQRLVESHLDKLVEDRNHADAEVEKLLADVRLALEQSGVERRQTFEQAKVSLAEILDNFLPTVQEDLDHLRPAQELLNMKVQDSTKYPLFPTEDYIVAEVPEPDDPAPPQVDLADLAPTPQETQDAFEELKENQDDRIPDEAGAGTGGGILPSGPQSLTKS